MTTGRSIEQWATDMLADDDLHVPEEIRVESDHEDPDSVAQPEGADLSTVDPDAGDIVDLRLIELDEAGWKDPVWTPENPTTRGAHST